MLPSLLAYRTFVGFLTLDLALNNSVMHVFCKLLLESRKTHEESSTFSDSGSEAEKYHLVKEGTSSPVAGQNDGNLFWMSAYS